MAPRLMSSARKRGVMNIQGSLVFLRALEETDLPKLHQWANDQDIQQMVGGWHFPTSTRDQQAWLLAQNCKSSDQRFAIVTRDNLLAGMANLVEIDWKNRNAFHGILLDEEFRGKGIATDAIWAIMRYSFEELGLQRLSGSFIESNDKSIALYTQKCGWKEEGRQRNFYFRHGRFWDKIITGITLDDYLEAKKRVK